MKRYEDGTQLRMRAGDIEVVPGHNPRTYFAPEAMTELMESVRDKGVFQSLLVRQGNEGQVQLIAGERRLRATLATRGPDELLPVIFRCCADSEMAALAMIENTSREAMGHAAEAEGAYRLMIQLRGNKEEVAAQLNWSVSKLERRLALMSATQEVRAALSARQIDLGHAELLAAVPAEKQNKALDAVIKQRLSVAVLRQEIGKLANALADGVFAKDECAACIHNSSQQNALFGEAIAEGHCTNPGCYDDKTMKHVEGMAAELRNEVPRVEVIKGDGAVLPIKLYADGPAGVGGPQAQACRGCANFGSTVSAVPGTVGRVERSVCFDADCNATKVLAHIKVVKEAKKAALDASKSVKSRGGTDAEAQKAAEDANAVTLKSTAPAAAGAISTRLKEYRLRVWRKTAAKAAFGDSTASRDLLIALGVAGRTRCIDGIKMSEVIAQLGAGHIKDGPRLGMGGKLKDVGEAVQALPKEIKGSLLDALAATAMANVEERDLWGSLDFLGVRLENFWSVDAEFLGLLTKSEIYWVCTEIGLVKQMGADEFKAAMAEKKENFIKAILACPGFDFKGAIPKSMTWGNEVHVSMEAESEEALDSGTVEAG